MRDVDRNTHSRPTIGGIRALETRKTTKEENTIVISPSIMMDFSLSMEGVIYLSIPL